ncbi:AAA family ATPase [Candidatus Halobeggiatoa sp. HSG11]|nr:AAA family ATPase [Candidatus Halobeggiatoa sp. HSG11]
MQKIKYIKKVEIKNMWNKYDIEWNLNENVNILAGDNGSGKTTILDLIAGTIHGELEERMATMVDEVKVTFNNDKYVTYQKVNAIFSHQADLGITKKELQEILPMGIVSTFDQPLLIREAINKLDKTVRTELDGQIFFLGREYLNYLVNIGKQAIKALSSERTNDNIQVDFNKNLFLDTIDILFRPTGKKIDRNKNELVFKQGKKELTPYELSSGEKQLIIIFLTVLIQEDRNGILFMDEAENSLHTDWQEKLIGNIKSLSSNSQIIMATHAPSIILDGWMDRVFEVPEIIKNN